MSKLFRVQDSEGRGPYRPGLSRFWSDDNGPIVEPWWIELGLSWGDGLKLVPDDMFSGSAFRSLEQLHNWFTAPELEKLDSLGFVLVRFRPDKIIAETPTQVLFAQHYPLSGLPVHGRLAAKVAA